LLPSVLTDSSPTGAVVAPRGGSARGGLRVPAPLLIVTGLTIVGAVFRLVDLTSQSYWFDEAQAAHALHLSFGGMLSAWSAGEPNPPLYFLIAWPWARIFGTGEGGLRALSAVLGIGLIPLVYLSGRELISRRAGLFAAALAAVNPFLIWYSQEAREYMLLCVLATASVLLFARAWREPTSRRLAWWALVAALALLTQYFAGFLIGAEAALLLWRARSRSTLLALAALVVVEAALMPHLTGHVSHPAGWIGSYPLSTRIQQVPVDFAISTLYLGPAVSYGLIGAAALAAVLIVLLVVGEDSTERLRRVGMAFALAAAVIVVPIVLAAVGIDYYEARALIPGWTPLALVIGAACAAAGTRAAGAGLAVILAAAFIYAGIVIRDSPQYEKPNWRAVAATLPAPHETRAVAAFDGLFAAAPLALYLPGVRWTGTGQTPQTSQTPVRVSELDVVASVYDTVARLPAGLRLISHRVVDGYQVDRFALRPAWTLSRASIAARAETLFGPGLPIPAVLIQRAPAVGAVS
jgi:Dolichyl-phosphate-mannose-protein mannosyltransferase